MQQHPERFSANVILRPVFQETILPNIAFIGGGGEISYWLQLKNVFSKANVDFPPIFLRNSFLLFKENQEQKLDKMNLSVEDLFAESELLFTNWVKQNTTQKINLTTEKQTAESFYEALQQKVKLVDTTLATHTKAIAVKALKKIETLEKKLLQAEKRKFIDQKNQLINIKQDLFYNNNLQERTENFSYLYSIYGSSFLDMILNCSDSFKQEFALIKMNT